MTTKSARSGLPYWLVAGGFFGLLAVGMVAAAVIYFRLIRYERVAAFHVPREAAFVLRLDVEQALVYEPFRRHLLPLADQGRVHAAGTAPVLGPRLERIKRHSGIELAVDVREVLIARGMSGWLYVIAGKFPKEGVTEGLYKVLEEEGARPQLAPHGRSLTLANGVALGQAADGAVLIASSREWLESALPRREPNRELGLDTDQAVALAAWRGAELASIWPALGSPPWSELHVQRVAAEVALASVPLLSVDVDLGWDAKPAAVEASIRRALSVAKARSAQTPHPARPAHDLRVTRPSPAKLRIHGAWPRENLNDALESVAVWLTQRTAP